MYDAVSYTTCVTASVKPPVALKKRKLSSKQLQQHNTASGVFGERRAVSFLSQKNYKILHTNLLFNKQEIDIVALDIAKDEIVFIEVKTIATDNFGSPANAINYTKLRNLRKAIGEYLQIYPSTKDIRIDSIAVLPNTITHYENITF